MFTLFLTHLRDPEMKEKLCPGISTNELLIDSLNLSSYPLPSLSELTLLSKLSRLFESINSLPSL